LSEAGIAAAVDIVAAVRAEVGPIVSLCIDHFGEGFMTADEAIRLGRALEPFNLTWLEDPLPWPDLVTGLDPNYMSEGYVTVPDAPGLGIDLNYDVIEENLRVKGTMSASTEAWNTKKLGFERVTTA
jgi:L-alanine-DL-glutamate epimerase-like enolase superfamily enzyme